MLAALADKSLLRKDGTRLHLHPLVQQLAAARLGEGEAERDATQAAHAAYFHRLLTQLRRPSRAASARRCAPSTTNSRTCGARGSGRSRRRTADTLAAAPRHCSTSATIAAASTSASRCCAEAIESPLAQADPAFGSLCCAASAAHVLYRLDRYPEAEAEATRALAATRRKRDPATHLQALNVLATCALRAAAGSRRPAATSSRRSTLASAERTRTRRGDARSPRARREGAGPLRRGAAALAAVARAASAPRDSRRRSALPEQSRFAPPGAPGVRRRRRYLQDALAICDRDGIVGTLQYVLSNLTEVTLHLGDLAAAESHARRTLETALATDHRALVGSAQFNLARLALRRGDLDTARSTLAAGVDTVLPIGIPILKFDALACFAEILQGQGERACARQMLAYATRHPAATPGVRAELQRLLDEAPSRRRRRWPAARARTRRPAAPDRRREQPRVGAAARRAARHRLTRPARAPAASRGTRGTLAERTPPYGSLLRKERTMRIDHYQPGEVLRATERPAASAASSSFGRIARRRPAPTRRRRAAVDPTASPTRVAHSATRHRRSARRGAVRAIASVASAASLAAWQRQRRTARRR